MNHYHKTPKHGGNLIQAAQEFNTSLSEWLDLSTGINPRGWPVPPLPASVFNRLPEADDELLATAYQYYQVENLLPVSGSQAAIQLLPQLRKHSRVGVICPGYQEHSYNWARIGHEVISLAVNEIDLAIDSLDVLILINPNNPTGDTFTQQQMLAWHNILQSKGGWLIIDEAFIDVNPSNSMLKHSDQEGIIVLRSLGKFFGLAGLRVGFVATNEKLRAKLAQAIGPWSISHPSRYIASHALADYSWQQNAKQFLNTQSKLVRSVLTDVGLINSGETPYFHWIQHKNSHKIFHCMAEQKIFIRYFEDHNSIRIGIPDSEESLLRVRQAFEQIIPIIEDTN